MKQKEKEMTRRNSSKGIII